MNDQDADDLSFRILQLLDGELGQEEVAQLDAELRNDPQARRLYLEFAQLHNALESRCVSRTQIGNKPLFSVEKLLARQRRNIVTKSLLAAAAVMMISLIALWLMTAKNRTASLASFEVASHSVFSLTHPGDDDSLPENILRVGSRLRVTTGAVEGKFTSGVRFVAEAPCDFRVLSEGRVALAQGAAWFEVPPAAIGFTVETKQLEIVDLGTRFGVIAPSRGEHEIHVSKGSVEVSSKTREHAKQKLILKAGQARRLDASGMLVSIPLDSSRFQTSLPSAPLIRNPGFENIDIFAEKRHPVGYGPISAWATSGEGVGAGGLDIPFLTQPARAGENVAFIQGKGAIAQSVSGFDPAKTYAVTYFVNERGHNPDGKSQPATRTSVSLDLGESFYEHPGLITKTDAFRRIVSGPLRVFGPTANITISGRETRGDASLLIDSVSISRAAPRVPEGGFENPVLPARSFNQDNGQIGESPWFFKGGAGMIANRSAFGAPSAPEGSQAAVFQDDAAIETAVQGFEPGNHYRLHFSASARASGGNSLRVSFGGDTLRFDGAEILKPTSKDFQPFASEVFEASAETLTLRIQSSGSGSTFCDDIYLEFVSEDRENFQRLASPADSNQVGE